MSGYDIKRSLNGFGWLGGSPSFGSLYPALHALLQDGMVTVDVIPRQDKPPRKAYNITEDGRREFEEWINQPAKPGISLKSFLMRLILADSLPRVGLVAQLEQRRAEVSSYLSLLEQGAEGDGAAGDLGRSLALEYGLVVANAELEWLDSAMKRLSGDSSPAEVAGSARLVDAA
jgi:DNA-binding PadR family transcriptional regulator